MLPDEALALFPDDSPYRVVLRGLLSTDEAQRELAKKTLQGMSRPYWEPPAVVDESVALAVVRAALETSFPPRANEWDAGPEELVFSIIGSATPAVIDIVESRYASQDDRMRLYLLTLVASAGTRRGAEFVAASVTRHGWPDRLFSRLFTELAKNLPHADALFPAILDAEGAPPIELGDLLLGALRTGALLPERMASSAIARALPMRIDDLMAQLPPLRGRALDDLADEERNIGAELAMLLDLAGYLGTGDVLPALHRASALPETWPASFAVASLLARGESVDDAVIARVARDPIALPALYSLLAARGLASRIPAELRSRDAFATADMARWLSHPGELGHPPDALEKMELFEAELAGASVVLYVWRFRSGDDTWKASVSGPYPADAKEGPLHGSQTFSKFEDWSSRTAEQHAEEILETLAGWRRATT